MAETPKLNTLEVEIVTEAVYAEAADVVIETQTAGLGRDFLALMTLLFIVISYHVQNPLLQFNVEFGRAFRNPSLQVVIAIGMVIGIIALTLRGSPFKADDWQSLPRQPLKFAAALILAVFALHVVLATVLDFNIFGVLLGVPQEAFIETLKPDDTTHLAAFETALTISTIVEYLALVGVVILWSPWTRGRIYRRAVRQNAPALIVALLVLALWEGLILVLNIQEFLLPRPSVIVTTFATIYSKGLISVGWNTFQNAFWGFVVGCSMGILTGLVSARFMSFSRALLPLAIAANSVPIIAFAPIMNNWFGALNPASKIAIVAILTYFPAMISTVKGLTSVDNVSLELMRSYAATPMETFRKLRIPTALPYMFSALKVGTTLSMIGAIVSEYFGGSTQGLGYRIREDAALFRYPESWSAIIVASALGIIFYLLVSAVERVVMPWHISFRDE